MFHYFVYHLAFLIVMAIGFAVLADPWRTIPGIAKFLAAILCGIIIVLLIGGYRPW